MSPSDFTDPRFLLDAAQTVAILVMWLRKPGNDAQVSAAKAAKAAEDVSTRVSMLELRIQHLPTDKQVLELAGSLQAIRATVAAIDQRQDGHDKVLSRIEQYLLTKKG